MELYFTQYFKLDPTILEEYGALDISIVSDLPLFIDPFLLFHSDKPEYQVLHTNILRYLQFLRDQADGTLSPALIKNWYAFKEVKQNWLGFTLLGNGGSGLGADFANSLHRSLSSILDNFGSETITRSSHLEKLCLISPGVGRDSISDFTTNLIKDYLLEYTQTFARTYLTAEQCSTFAVTRAKFNYSTHSWQTGRYLLPKVNNDYVLLTPLDLLTRDDTWISHWDMVDGFDNLPIAIEDDVLRAQINQYFLSQLSANPTQKEHNEAASKTIKEYPILIDHYIKEKEDCGDEAQILSEEKTEDLKSVLIEQVKLAIPDIEANSDFYDIPWTSYDEVKQRVASFKHYVEHEDGWRVINRNGVPFSREAEVQLFFGLIWCNSDFDVNREPNNGRGPVDFKVSYGSKDKSLIEFKLARSTSLKRNMEKQVAIYEEANGTRSSMKVIVCYTAEDQARAAEILAELNLLEEESIVMIDARNDNKPSASTA